MTPIIRDASARDHDAILEINADCVPEVSLLTAPYLAQLIRESEFFRVVALGVNVLGYLCALNREAAYDAEEFLWFRQEFRERFYYIDQVAIRRSCRRRRLAHLLYDDLERLAAANDVSMLACEVNCDPANLPSQAFHSRRGFGEVGRMSIRSMCVSLLVKRLASSDGQRITGAGESPADGPASLLRRAT